MSEGLVAELPWLWAGLGAYAVATIMAVWGVISWRLHGDMQAERRYEKIVLAALLLGILLLSAAIAARWVRIGHGPWISLFELLMSQLWSLGLIFSLVYWRVPAIRGSAVVALPLMWILGTWVLTLEPTASHFPATYYNNWKWAHVFLGKIYLALLLIGVGLSGIMIMRRFIPASVKWFSLMPADEALDPLAWRLMIMALVFDSLMLIAGAVWAQDAWGRYWAWDALETSAFMTWLALAVGLHLRVTLKVRPWVGGMIIWGVFFLAFTTYFGTPYLSPAAHKGMV